MEREEKHTGGELLRLEGTVENVIYSNEENGYAICDVASAEDEMITIVGTLPLVGEGDHLILYGKWVHNPKYGRQFSVTQYERKMPSDTASILRYLSARTVKGIGPKTAQLIVERFGEDTFEVLENHPDWLAEIKGISRKSAEKISENFKEQAGMRSAMMFFREYFGAAMTVKIYKRWGSAAVDIAKRNPYRLCNEIDGIGFEKADTMAVSLGLSGDHLERIMSGIRYVLRQNASQHGHTCLPRKRLCQEASAILGVTEEQSDEAVSALLRSGLLAHTLRGEETMIYDRETYENEKFIASKLVLLYRMCSALSLPDIDRFIEREEMKNDLRYAPAQKQAISDALRYGVLVLTGGPGTGKTTIVRALIHIFDSMGFDVALAAPTGRAAKRLSESTSMEAKTIHRLLEMGYSEEGTPYFGRNENDLLDENVIIVDEASMVDTQLMAALLRAVKPGARFLFIGDADQLPSVGAGNVLRDVIASGRFATVRLTEIFRQAGESLIVTNAHAINEGRSPRIDVKDNDFFFLHRERDMEIADTVVELCRTRLPKAYGEMAQNGIQVICPSRKGEAGTATLNLLLQRALNPPTPQKAEYTFRGVTFRQGDRVMQTRNNYDLFWTRERDDKPGTGIFNGDIGIIEEIDKNDMTMVILFEDRRVIYDFTLLEDLEHAYAITVHKSQGSEYPIVILPLCSSSPFLLTRNLLYTAVTRGQKMVILVGREAVMNQMVENNRQTMRYTGLCERLAMGDKTI